MEDLIKALQIFAKYEKDDVVNCDHDVLTVCVDPEKVTEADKAELEKLSFIVSGDFCSFHSFRFWSC